MSKKNYEDFVKGIEGWICKKLFQVGNAKVKNYDLIGKYRGSVHQYFKINLTITKKIPTMFHHFQNSHLLFQEVGKCNFNFDAIINKEYMSFTIEPAKNLWLPLAFIASIHFLKDSFDNLV